jgi:hypothetical protein
MADWHRLRFLESVENLKPRVRSRFGREPNTGVAQEIIACLLQGRLFYEAASAAPMEIRPLQLFYGMVGFAKALIVASRCTPLATLRQAHGLRDISGDKCRIADLQVRIGTAGTFQEFNDSVAPLTRFCYFDGATPLTLRTPSATADQVRGFDMSLQEILSRIPTLETLYRMTFGHDANTASLSISFDQIGKCSIRLDDPEPFNSREELKAIVTRWRARFPFLQAWRVVEAQRAWGNSVIHLQNSSNGSVDEFSEFALMDLNGSFIASHNTLLPDAEFQFAEHLAPMAGGYTGGHTYAITPVRDQYFSEFSLHFLGLFLLSSLVRYRPQTWVHAISRGNTSDAPADDKALSLIESFLEFNRAAIPQMVVTVLNPQEDQFRTG